MGLAPLILLALCGRADAHDPAARVADLASPREAVRAEAAGALEELGRPALPALYRARDSDDPDLRRRVEHLIDLIERQRLLRATKVRLDFEDVALPAVAEALHAQTGFSVAVGPDKALRGRRVTLRVSEPVPFWQALDRLGATCGVRHNPGVTYWPLPREPTVLLGPAEGPPVPASDDGPFRVHLVRLARHREAIPGRPPAGAKYRESFSVDLQVFAEPGLAVNPTGPVRLEEAVDDRGRDLRPDSTAGSYIGRLRPPRFDEGYAALLPLPIRLKPGDGPGGRLRRLKGRVPISVVARTGDPLVVPLAGAEGKSFSKGGIALGVAGVDHLGKNTSVRLTMRAEQIGRSAPPEPARPLGEFQPPYWVEDHVQIQDDQGRALWWNAGPLRNLDGGRLETLLTVYSERGDRPARVLYYGVVGAATEVAFEFNDLPLP